MVAGLDGGAKDARRELQKRSEAARALRVRYQRSAAVSSGSHPSAHVLISVSRAASAIEWYMK